MTITINLPEVLFWVFLIPIGFVVLFFTIGFLTFLCLQGLDKLTKWLGFFDEKE